MTLSDAPTTNTFGSTEGLVGMSEPDELPIVFNSDVCIIELVDERGRPVPPGVPSASVLITNLANRLQPLIRYELADRFLRQPPAPDHGHLRATVEGRSGEVLDFAGTAIHPMVIGSVLSRARGASDYQVRQTARGIELDVLADGPLDLEALGREVADALRAAGLPEAEVAARCVPALARAADTGKLRRFVPA